MVRIGQQAVILFILIAFCTSLALAAAPVELNADEALEWRRDQKLIIARGQVVVTQGDTALRCDKASASYSEGPNGTGFKLLSLKAEKNVEIQTPDGTAYGDLATYDVSTGQATLTGTRLMMTSQDMTLQAEEKFDYDVKGGVLRAVKNALLVQKSEKGENKIQADVLKAIFITSRITGKRELDRMEAEGAVVITTPTEVITGDRGVYNRLENTAELNGNIKIKRGVNTLTGERATVDLNANISTLTGGTGRVKGVFYPE